MDYILCPRRGIEEPPFPLHCHFGPSLSASFGLFYYHDGSTESLHVLAMPSTLAPHRLDAGSYILASRFECPASGFKQSLKPWPAGYVVRGLYTVGYPAALPRRVVLVGEHVTSENPRVTIIQATSRRNLY